ncbi:MAG: hypothetical protein ABI323_03725 [Solirubrobacteraceae bacterium]
MSDAAGGHRADSEANHGLRGLLMVWREIARPPQARGWYTSEHAAQDAANFDFYQALLDFLDRGKGLEPSPRPSAEVRNAAIVAFSELASGAEETADRCRLKGDPKEHWWRGRAADVRRLEAYVRSLPTSTDCG